MQESSSLDWLGVETRDRLHHLHVSHSQQLEGMARKISGDREVAEELVSDLYLYLLEKPNAAIFYSTSFNLYYCKMFLRSRFINRVKKGIKWVGLGEAERLEDIPYDEVRDQKFEACWNGLLYEMDRMKKEKGWSSILLFEHYMMSDKTLEEVSKEIGISITTTFTNVNKAKKALRERLNNPFGED
jgi:DNA-directed RNA polymerase specialized sigma24 family protein